MYMCATSCIKLFVDPRGFFFIFLIINILKFFRPYNFLRFVRIRKDRWAIDRSLTHLAWYANGRRVSRPFTYRRSSKIELHERVRWISARYHLIELYFVSREFVDTPSCRYEANEEIFMLCITFLMITYWLHVIFIIYYFLFYYFLINRFSKK